MYELNVHVHIITDVDEYIGSMTFGILLSHDYVSCVARKSDSYLLNLQPMQRKCVGHETAAERIVTHNPA